MADNSAMVAAALGGGYGYRRGSLSDDARRRMIAALQGRGVETTPVTKAGGLARAGQGLISGLGMGYLIRQDAEAQDKRSKMLAAALRGQDYAAAAEADPDNAYQYARLGEVAALRKQQEARDKAAADAAIGGYGGTTVTPQPGPAPQEQPTPQQPAPQSPAMPQGEGRASGFDNPGGAYNAGVRRQESGGNDQAVNPLSGATGRYQFMPQTWAGLAKQDPTLTDPRDPAQQERAMAMFTAQNRLALAPMLQRDPKASELRLAHYFGAQGAANLLRADPNATFESLPDGTYGNVRTATVIAQNPNLKGRRVGELVREYQAQFDVAPNPEAPQPQLTPGQQGRKAGYDQIAASGVPMSAAGRQAHGDLSAQSILNGLDYAIQRDYRGIDDPASVGPVNQVEEPPAPPQPAMPQPLPGPQAPPVVQTQATAPTPPTQPQAPSQPRPQPAQPQFDPGAPYAAQANALMERAIALRAAGDHAGAVKVADEARRYGVQAETERAKFKQQEIVDQRRREEAARAQAEQLPPGWKRDAEGRPYAEPGGPADPTVIQRVADAKRRENLKAIPPTVSKGMQENLDALRQLDRTTAELDARLAANKDSPGVGGTTGFIAANMPYGEWITQHTDPGGVKLRALIADIGSLKIHDRSGAAVTAAEFPRLRPFIPSPQDTPATVRTKLQNFRAVYEDMLRDADGYYGEDAGYRPYTPYRQYRDGAGQTPAAAPANPNADALKKKYGLE